MGEVGERKAEACLQAKEISNEIMHKEVYVLPQP
jgi:hypothetical protein